ncbi:hypothetical protein Bca101_021787 [Brassica carinata]
MAELLRNPELMVKAQEEIREVIGENDAVKELDVFKLPYLQAVVKETLVCILLPLFSSLEHRSLMMSEFRVQHS